MSGMQEDPRDLDRGTAAVALMLERVGGCCSAEDRELLLAHGSDLLTSPDARQDRFAAIYESALRGFFHCAADGVAFVSLDRFSEELGASLEHTYPGAGPAFLRLCVTYWTLRMLEGRLRLRYAGLALQQVLLAIEVKVGEAWFPEAEPADEAGVDELVQRQRRLIVDSGAAIDIDELLFGNPSLMGNPLR